MWVHWWDIHNRVLIDGGKGQPGKRVAVRSEHHRAPPGGYVVLERIPKWIRGDTRFKTRRETSLARLPSQASSYVWSEPWLLAAPRDERSIAEYQAFPSNVRQDDPRVVSYTIRCSELFIERERRSSGLYGEVAPAVVHPGGAIPIGSVGGGNKREIDYRGSAPIDPSIEVELVQGESLARHLIAVARGFQGTEPSETFEFSTQSITYFAGRRFDIPGDPVVAVIQPAEPLYVALSVGDSDNVRCAFAIEMLNRETGVRAISDPTFLTSVRGSIIATDLPADLLSSASASILLTFADAEGDLAAAADALGIPEETAWSRIESATEELGTDSVDDAVAFVAFNRDAQAREPAYA